MKKYLYATLIVLIAIGGYYLLNKKPAEKSLLFGAIGTPSNLTHGNSSTGATSYTTASVSPTGNSLELLTVVTRTGITANPNEPTVTGNSLTWVKVDTVVFDDTSSSRKRLTVFRAMGSSPTSGTITIDLGGQSQTAATWALDEFSGVDTSGTNGSGAIVQFAQNHDNGTTATSLTVTLSAFSSANNATYGSFGFSNFVDNTYTQGSGFSLLSNDGTGTSVAELTEYNLSNDTSVDVSWTPFGQEVGGIAIEIKAASSCTYSGSGNWDVKYSDNCYLTTNTYIVGACNFIFDSAGSFGLANGASISCADIRGGAGFKIQAKAGAKIYAR